VSASDKADATAKTESKPGDAAEPIVIDYNEADIQSACALWPQELESI